jgi:formamidopyrimidine-DNA glycosylase
MGAAAAQRRDVAVGVAVVLNVRDTRRAEVRPCLNCLRWVRQRRDRAGSLHRPIVAVGDTDSYVCRPRPPEQISQAPAGRCLIVRQGALADGRRLAAQQGTARSAAHPGRSHPQGGRHGNRRRQPTGEVTESRATACGHGFADVRRRRSTDVHRAAPARPRPSRPPLDLDPAAVPCSPGSRGPRWPASPCLLAVEILWLAWFRRRARRTSSPTTKSSAMSGRPCRPSKRRCAGGVRAVRVVPHRRPGGHCPPDGAAAARSMAGGRTGWWCSSEQAQEAKRKTAGELERT